MRKLKAVPILTAIAIGACSCGADSSPSRQPVTAVGTTSKAPAPDLPFPPVAMTLEQSLIQGCGGNEPILEDAGSPDIVALSCAGLPSMLYPKTEIVHYERSLSESVVRERIDELRASQMATGLVGNFYTLFWTTAAPDNPLFDRLAPQFAITKRRGERTEVTLPTSSPDVARGHMPEAGSAPPVTGNLDNWLASVCVSGSANDFGDMNGARINATCLPFGTDSYRQGIQIAGFDSEAMFRQRIADVAGSEVASGRSGDILLVFHHRGSSNLLQPLSAFGFNVRRAE